MREEQQREVAGSTQEKDATGLASPGVSSRVTELVESYDSFGKKSVEGILGLAQVVEQAHQDLGKRDLYAFYDAIKLEYKSPTSKKLRKIGAERTRFTPVLHKLPNTWTTIYALASLKASEFDQLVRDDVLHPLVTLNDITDHLHPPSKQKHPARRVALDLSKIRPGKAGDFARRLKALCAEFNLDLGEPQLAAIDAFLVPNGTSGES